MSLIFRGLRVFENVVLAIAKSTPKKTCFTLEERVQMAKE
ncbi:MAG TPA: pantetheine-phosphate adenylyltransferase, partial [Humidesulfovibrio sp.]|nr:pantetheine-phosphate adenylyltransferase [Humidesulfovibrio sp.]